MSRGPPSAHMQVVETDENHLLAYIATEEKWNNVVRGANLQNQNYCVISIMGPQSSGKSTILNRIFGCNFSTMDSRVGRQQTTTGIWISNSPKGGDVLVMDLEGTDSTQRNENRVNFERQTSLFALSLSEVLIINMWSNEIGRVSGMNLDTLKSILEANLRLNYPRTRTLLLFLIREQHPDDSQPGVTPKATLASLITQHLEQVWMNIDKPEDYANTPLRDLFEVKFYFVAPLVYCAQEFEKNCVDLYRRFTDPTHPEYYFNTEYHFRKSMPLEDLYDWTRQLWDSISKDESLNIPDQARLLSAYRCEAAVNASYQKLVEMLRPTVIGVEQNKYMSSCGRAVDDAVAEAKRMYQMAASKYLREEAEKKLLDLMDKIRSFVLSRIFTIQMSSLTDQVVQSFEKTLQASLPRDQCAPNFEQTVIECRQRAEQLFRERFAESCPETLVAEEKAIVERDANSATQPEEDENDQARVDASDFARMFDRTVVWEEIGKRLRDVTKTSQGQQYNKLLNVELQQLTDDYLKQPLGTLFANPPVGNQYRGDSSRDEIKYETNPTLNPTASVSSPSSVPSSRSAASAAQVNGFWRDVSNLRIEFHGRILATRIIPKLERLMYETDMIKAKAEELRDSTDEFIRGKIESFANGIEGTAKTIFDRHFLSDPSTRVPRMWTPTSPIETIFMESRDAVDQLFEIVSVMNVEGNEQLGLEPMTRRVLSSDNLGILQTSLEAYMNRSFQDCRNRMLGHTSGGVFPTHPLQWLILLFFAWNEIWSILTNPIYLFGAIFLVVIFFVTYQMQTIGFDVKTIVQSTLQRVLKMAIAQLKQAIEQFGNDNSSSSMGNGAPMESIPPRRGMMGNTTAGAGRRSSVPTNSMSNHSDVRQRRVQSEVVSHANISGLNIPENLRSTNGSEKPF